MSQLRRFLYGIIGGISHNKSHSKLFAMVMGWDKLKLLKVSKSVLEMKTI